MRKSFVQKGLVFLVSLFLFLPIPAKADLSPKMNQGDFALWLAKAVDALDQLPPAASPQDAIDFFTKLGVVPDGGWDKNATITNGMLASLLDEEGASGLPFDELVNRVRDHVKAVFKENNLGIFRAFANSASGSAAIPG